tara:strand:- start:652 stop:828 length:177 start_codon:yes stop_codon:yes gene_type:complete
MSNEDDEHYEEWYEKNQEGLVDDFLRDNKQFDNICWEIYKEEMKENEETKTNKGTEGR